MSRDAIIREAIICKQIERCLYSYLIWSPMQAENVELIPS